MDGFFNPQGVAIFGVSPSPGNLARTIIQNLNSHKYQGNVVGIGSRERTMLGVKIYKSINDVKEHITLAIILTPAPTVVPILKDCQKAGIKRVVIMSGGFQELKGSRDQLSAELIKVAEETDIRFIGPNCQGPINTRNGACLPFGFIPPEKLKQGDISIIAQSGTVLITSPVVISHEISGVNKAVSIGNKMNVDEVDILEYLFKDEATRLIILHLESTERGRELFELLSRSPKPVILFKTQVYPESSSVAYSHTAALADDDRIVEGACLQAGVMRAATFREMIEMAKALSLPPIKGNRLGIISASGGMGIMAADACKREEMKLAKIPDECLAEIATLPKARVIKVSHPVDTGNIFDNRDILHILKMVMKVDEVEGGILSQFHSNTGGYFEGYPVDEFINKVADLSRDMEKPVALHLLCDPLTREEIKAHAQFPLFDSIEEAVCALNYLWRFEIIRQRAKRWEQSLEISPGAPFRFDNQVSPDLEGFRLLSQYEIPSEHPVPVRDKKEILKEAERMGYPLALKVLSPDFTHKRSHGAVALDLKNESELTESVQRMVETLKINRARIETFLLQKMAPAGPELIFGGRKDPHYGPVILLGLGGIEVEIKKEVTCYLAPISPAMAEDMLASLDIPFRKGSPGHEPLKEALSRFSQLLVDNPRIQEIDLNPVRLLPEKGLFKVLDVRIKLESSKFKSIV